MGSVAHAGLTTGVNSTSRPNSYLKLEVTRTVGRTRINAIMQSSNPMLDNIIVVRLTTSYPGRRAPVYCWSVSMESDGSCCVASINVVELWRDWYLFVAS